MIQISPEIVKVIGVVVAMVGMFLVLNYLDASIEDSCPKELLFQAAG